MRARALLAVLAATAACASSPPPPAGEARDRAATPARPSDPDGDGDGVEGHAELCADDAEDMDGFEDGDGCPEPDNDQDRRADADDQCPDDAETYNGYEDVDGCPDRGQVVVTDIVCPILDHIYFRHRSAAIQTASMPILDATAETIVGNPQIERIAVVGTSARNERNGDGLSLARADAVRTALIQRGVDPQRLEAIAAGTRLDVGRGPEHNRRIDFYITRSDGQDVEVPELRRVTAP